MNRNGKLIFWLQNILIFLDIFYEISLFVVGIQIILHTIHVAPLKIVFKGTVYLEGCNYIFVTKIEQIEQKPLKTIFFYCRILWYFLTLTLRLRKFPSEKKFKWCFVHNSCFKTGLDRYSYIHIWVCVLLYLVIVLNCAGTLKEYRYPAN